jgi:peptidoglycan/xylan/chitin deacetylase (PgdA/CDA1 family)
VHEAMRNLKRKGGPSRILSITFDDGYKDNAMVALPILNKHKVKATFFISSGFLYGQWMWNDGIFEVISNITKNQVQTKFDLSKFDLGSFDLSTIEMKRRALDLILEQVKYKPDKNRRKVAKDLLSAFNVPPPENLMMREDDIKTLYDAGMEIGGHTISHPILSKLSYQDAHKEIFGCKILLENVIQAPVRTFAYPNGKPVADYTEHTIEIVKKAGYQYAVSTVPETLTSSISDPYQLPRFTPWDRNPVKFTTRLLLKMLAGQR